MTRNQIRQELRRCIREAVREVGGTGGIKECEYCIKRSKKGTTVPGPIEHYRKGVKSNDPWCDVEADEHCVVTVMKAALEALS